MASGVSAACIQYLCLYFSPLCAGPSGTSGSDRTFESECEFDYWNCLQNFSESE